MNLTVPVTEVNSMETIKIINNIAVVTPSIKTISVEYEISQYCIKAVMKKLNFMVEATRVELVSETVSTGNSPGAVHVLYFPHYNAHEQAL